MVPLALITHLSPCIRESVVPFIARLRRASSFMDAVDAHSRDPQRPGQKHLWRTRPFWDTGCVLLQDY